MFLTPPNTTPLSGFPSPQGPRCVPSPAGNLPQWAQPHRRNLQSTKTLTFSPATWNKYTVHLPFLMQSNWQFPLRSETMSDASLFKCSTLYKKLPHKYLGHGQTRAPCSGRKEVNAYYLWTTNSAIRKPLQRQHCLQGFRGAHGIISRSFGSVLRSW